MRNDSVMIGTAGWAIPRAHTKAFDVEGSHLERYARVMPCAEINSSFYREHSVETYRRWASVTPPRFRFAVKLPSVITHEQRLRRARTPLRRLLSQVRGLGPKLGPLLIQLPPSLEFDARIARSFFALVRDEFDGTVACEPRHASWFSEKTNLLLNLHRIGRVAADPTSVDDARVPGGWVKPQRGASSGIAYYRLHGSPRKYWSSYERPRLQSWAAQIACVSSAVNTWCIFDNTASGAALGNALELMQLVRTEKKRIRLKKR
jgi:uncharacterized protein YecE (DUF72 family)